MTNTSPVSNFQFSSSVVFCVFQHFARLHVSCQTSFLLVGWEAAYTIEFSCCWLWLAFCHVSCKTWFAWEIFIADCTNVLSGLSFILIVSIVPWAFLKWMLSPLAIFALYWHTLHVFGSGNDSSIVWISVINVSNPIASLVDSLGLGVNPGLISCSLFSIIRFPVSRM